MSNFCPKCGGKLAKRFIAADERTRQVCEQCGVTHYQNSKPTAAILTLRDGHVLLVKRGIEPFKGYWDIPGGFLEAEEHPKEAAIREMREETGLLIEPLEILGIYIDQYGTSGDYTLNICYIAKVIGGTPKASSDATDLKWFPLDALPEQIAFEWSYEALNALRQRRSQELL